MAGKRTLATTILHRHLLAAALTLGTMMLILLVIADVMAMRTRSHDLALSLKSNVDDADIADHVSTPPKVGKIVRKKKGSHAYLDSEGRLNHNKSEPTAQPAISDKHSTNWNEAHKVIEKGEAEGKGNIPWESEPVVWAARKVPDPSGQGSAIHVAWDRISEIRAASSFTYLSVIIAMLLAFAISVILALRSTKYVTGVLDTIAESSTRMASGDFHIQLPAQPTEELDRVTMAINHLARDLEQTTEKLHSEHARLERLEALQRQFVADASHELRSPLTAIRVTLEAWQDGILRPDEEPKALEQVVRETERLGLLIRHLLDISRIESGRDSVVMESISPAEVAEEVCAIFRDIAGAAICMEIPPDIPEVIGDRNALHRILQNLLENSRRFTDSSGSIRVWAEAVADRVRIGVSDTGCGIQPDDLPRIWDRFARAESARANGQAGSGLGLAIVKGLVESMGGSVGAESTPGVGATVWLELPMAAILTQG